VSIHIPHHPVRG